MESLKVANDKQQVDKVSIVGFFKGLQDRITEGLELVDGKCKFTEDLWERPGGGGGRTRTTTNGHVLEKGGVGFSAVEGITPAKIAGSLGVSEQSEFFATGVSLVMHPQNPFVPIIHMNVRYFEMNTGHWWFGGGIDLTPHYVDFEDAKWFHQQLKAVCDKHDPSYYPKFKAWADDYFFLSHRNETRGVGGIFFDRLSGNEADDKKRHFAFVADVGNAFVSIYRHFMQKNATNTFEERHKLWQSLRRSRYVEFNLVHDVGTKFGLETNGRTESILMSMPPMAQWIYNYQTETGSEEEKTLQWLKKGVNWLE